MRLKIPLLATTFFIDFLCVVNAVHASDTSIHTKQWFDAEAIIGSPTVPGAIVCKDHQTVMSMVRVFNIAWEDVAESAAIGKAKAEQLRGASVSPPRLKNYGCIFLPKGTKMKWDGNWIPPVVTGRLENGLPFQGVTDGSMLKVVK